MELEEFDIEFLAQKMSENPASPLFARLADLYLSKEQNAEAMKLLEDGLQRFPEYYAGYIVLGKAHLSFKEYSRAYTAFTRALELSPFSQTAAHLLTTVPNKPDESTRTTDENYFTPPAAVPQQQMPEPVLQETPAAEETVPSDESFIAEAQASSTFESMTAEEIGFTQSVEEPAAEYPTEPIVETQYGEPVSQETFPTFDEYFAQNQSRINLNSTLRLDDYLSGATPVETAPAAEEIPQHEFINEAYVEQDTTAEPVIETAPAEAHVDPEPVFASPEQAQLFAEMTGMDVSSSATASTTDLDELTEKLQSAEKIIPEENYQPKSPPPKEIPEEQAYESDAVTPTLAEIYASQGEYRAAIQAYEILMFSQPAKGGEFQKRIRELQQLQMEKDGLI